MRNDKNIMQLISWFFKMYSSQKTFEEYKSSVVVHTPWSMVIKFEIREEIFYLKQTPPKLFVEASIINCIDKNIQNAAVPKVLFVNNKLHCFAMKSCGNYSLRTKFDGQLDADLLTRGIKSYIRVQRNFEHDLSDLKKLGVPDWRIANLPCLYNNLIEKEEMLLEEGLLPSEISDLKKLSSMIESICQEISKHAIKETLVNCDFNENNMIFNERTKQISIIDWVESVLAHPLFSLAAHLQNTARRYQLDIKGEKIFYIKQAALACWSDAIDKNSLCQLYKNIERLLPIFTALGLYRLQVATNNKSKVMQRWFIKDSLKMLIKNLF